MTETTESAEAPTGPAAFFLPIDDGSDARRFLPTELCRGPWSADAQHGGPPSALLARALAKLVAPGARLTRMTVDFLRPVPLTELVVETEVLRQGRIATTLAGSITAAGKPVIRATALAIREASIDLPALAMERDPAPRHPDQCEPFEFPFFNDPVGYHAAMEVRFAEGTFGQGRATAWMRMRVPLLAGETPAPFERVMVAADSGNGISVVLDTAKYTFVNPDLSVHIHRPPVGEWIGMHALTLPEASGIGITDDRLYDTRGPIGRAVQSLVVDARAPAVSG